MGIKINSYYSLDTNDSKYKKACEFTNVISNSPDIRVHINKAVLSAD